MLTTHLPALSTGSSLAAEGISLNHSAISSLLTLLGWQDPSSAITQASDAERTLAENLQAAYARYVALPDQSSMDNLDASLTAVINKLEKDKATASRLAKEASDRMIQETADYPHAGLSALIGGLTTKFKTLLGSHDVTLAHHYHQLSAKYTAQLEELIHLRATLQSSRTSIIEAAAVTEIAEHPSSQRQLLHAANHSENQTDKPVCYRFGAYRGALSKDYSGFTLQGEAEGDESGYSVSTAGDINGDGLSDILIGAYGALSYTGKSYVVLGSRNSTAWGLGKLNISSLMDGQRGFVLQGEVEGDRSGLLVSTAGDINGDGLSDILVGAPSASSRAGKSYVVLGSRNSTAWGSARLNISSLMDGQRGFVLQGEGEKRRDGYGYDDLSGASVSTAGDINGDRLSDILVGTPRILSGAGKSYVVFGSRNSTAWGLGNLNISRLMDGQRGFVLQGEAKGDFSGSSVSTAGDINGDGLADILVGAPGLYSPSSPYVGKSYIMFGSPLYFTANSLRIGVGESVQLNAQNLAVASTRSDIDVNTLGVTVKNVENGYFLMNSPFAPSVNVTHFYMQNISEGTIYFVHTGGTRALNYTVVIDSGGVPPLSICSGVQVDYFNLMNNQFAVAQNLAQLKVPLIHKQVCVTNEDCNHTVLNDHLGFVLQGEAKGDESGYSVSAAGDINGDGLSDILVGAPDALSDAGKSYVVFGSRNSTAWGPGTLNISSLMDGQRGFVLQGEAKGDQSGFSVSAAGDLNGDGLSDILVGAPAFLSSPGKSYVMFGSRNSTAWGLGTLNMSSLMDGQRGFVLQGEEEEDLSGYSVSTAEDLNGDGLCDILVGAPYASSYAGKSYVVFGSRNSTAWGLGTLNISDLMDGQRGFVLQGEAKGDQSGFSVSAAGDLNGDGLSDILVGAPQASSGAGKSYVVFGSRNTTAWGPGILNMSSLMDGQRGFVLQGEEEDDLSGQSVSTVGDINGDGLSDILVGAPGTLSAAGKSYVVFGSRNSTAWWPGTLNISSLIMDGQHGFVLQGEANYDRSGYSVSAAGDLNGDGLSDILVGAYHASSDAGKSYVVFGSRNSTAWWPGTLNISSLIDGQRGFVLQGEANHDESGSSVSAAGDINGDGLSDILVGAPAFLSSPGKSYVVFGVSFPFYFTANFLRIGAMETVQLNSTFLAVASTRLDIDMNTLSLSIENLTGGYFVAKSAPTKKLIQFTMQNITDGSIQFVHTSGALAPTYTVVISNMSSVSPYPTYFDAQIDFLGYRPNLVNNKLIVNQGMATLLEASDLSVSDQDNIASDLTFIISNLTYGQFTLYNVTTNTTVNTSKFSYQDVLDKHIYFIHNGSRNVPGYTVTVADKKSVTKSQAATVTFNYAPQMNITSLPVIIDQGQATTLNSQDISASDDKTFADTLIIYVTNVSYGHFAYANNPNRSITAFEQLSLTTDTVQFVQDGSNSRPSFALCAFDGILNSSWQSPPQLQLNHRPMVVGKMENQTVIEDEEFNFPSSLLTLFYDPDSNDTLTYNAQQKGGVPLPPEIRFTSSGNFEGKLLTTLTFTIEIEARDARGVMNSTSFVLSSQLSDFTKYQRWYASVSGIGGVALTALAYLWLRKRVASHRRDFAFANALRKALNLEYHDFMRFGGDTYKTKISEFMMQLQSEHQRFYTTLTPKEQKSFAVCVGEILVKHNLVSPSDCASGVYGLLFLLSVGWSLQLDLKKFEVQSPDIAAEAVTAWKSCDAPLERWPYRSPKMKDKTKAFCCAKPSRAGMFASSFNLKRDDEASENLRNRKVHRSPLVLNSVLERKSSHSLEIEEAPFLAMPDSDDSQQKQKRSRCSVM